jgi:transposase
MEIDVHEHVGTNGTCSGTYKHPVVREWLAANPRVHFHFTPIGGSWMNQVETWFSVLQRRAITRGVFRSVTDLRAAINRFLTGWNQQCRPFSWVKSADAILTKASRPRITESVH